MRSTLIRFLAALSLSLLSTLVQADDSGVFVEQITARDTPQESERQIANFSTEGSGRISAIDVNRLDQSLRPNVDGGGTFSAVNQRGRQNSISVTAVGSGNVTFQHQQGVRLTSDITLVGRRNTVGVDQRGAGLDSDIQVVGGNKVIFHVQRGQGPSSHHQPLIYTGTQREAELIVDTPKGRLTKSLAN